MGGVGGSGNVVSVNKICCVLGPVSSGELGEECDATSESKLTVDAVSAGPLLVGKLSSTVVTSVVKLKTVDHLPIMSAFNSGAAAVGDYCHITVDAFGSTFGVL